MKCQYCHTFSAIPKSLRRIEKNFPKPNISYRYCRHIHKEVTTQTESCEHLTPTTFFWCKKQRGWVHILCCITKRRKKVYPCAYCKQYLEVEYVCVGRDMFALFGAVRKEIKPVKPTKPESTEKPVLKRRKA